MPPRPRSVTKKSSPIFTQRYKRHTTAMEMLRAGVGRTVIALWLGHESAETTQMYLDADLEMKSAVLAKTTVPSARRGKYRPPDPLLRFLESL
nr:tyrosine-type recombinase/integrase [Paraburkholderia aspalathi]